MWQLGSVGGWGRGSLPMFVRTRVKVFGVKNLLNYRQRYNDARERKSWVKVFDVGNQPAYCYNYAMELI